MELSTELVSQLVKATQDTEKKSTETTLYGTVKIVSGAVHVQLDGSTTTTPVTSTTDVSDGDRVTVMIKDHSAIITGNVSSPSANSSAVKGLDKKVGEFSTVLADKVNTKDFYAEQGRINTLVATTAKIEGTLEATNAEVETLTAKNVTIEETLEAHKANIDSLTAETVKTTYLEANFATIKDLEVVDQKVYNLDATYLEFSEATGENLSVINASIKNLEAENVEIKGTLTAQEGRFENLEVENITITGKLTAVTGDIKDLEADNADIRETLTSHDGRFVNLEADNATIKGTLTAHEGRFDDLETNSLRADSAVITQLQADIAKIDVLEADVADIDTLIFGSASGNTIQTEFSNAVIAQLGDAQIKSAMIQSIDTSKVRVSSEDGKLDIYDNTIQISDGTRVRVQIGKDDSGDYSISVWNADGNPIFSEGGITEHAITDKIIRNDMVSENANISASKLYLDEEKQTLDVAFKNMSTDLDDTKETVTSQGTQLSVVQGQISNKVWQQDISSAINPVKGDITTLSTNYSTLNQTVDGISATVASHTTELAEKADGSAVTAVNNRVTNVETSIDGFKTEVSKTIDGIEIGARNLLRNSQTLIFAEYYFQKPELFVEHDGDGNVAIVSAIINVAHDGDGNVDFGSSIIATDDGFGNITLNGGA